MIHHHQQIQAPQIAFDDDTGTLLSSVIVIDRDALVGVDRQTRAMTWLRIHEGASQRLAGAVGRYFLDHKNVTIHEEPPYCVPAWEGNPDAVAYVLSAVALKHRDLSHALHAPDNGAGVPIRLHTACGCESRTMHYPAPLPRLIHKSTDGGGVRAFRRAGVNDFGVTTYTEVHRHEAR